MSELSNRQMIVRVVFHIVILDLLLKTCFAKDVSQANFVFGDSLVDAGNNNYIASLFKADFESNGIDFGGPTGRFMQMISGQELGLPGFTPPYLAPTTRGPVVLHGVNYASGGAGILNHTGNIFVRLLPKLLQSSLFSVTMESNDFINNYFTPIVSAEEQRLVPPEMFVASMIARFRQQLTINFLTDSVLLKSKVDKWFPTVRLYNLGARKIIAVNVGPIGCIPYERDLNPTSGDNCATRPNQLAQQFNAELRSLINELNIGLKGSILLYADVYRIVDNIIHNYRTYGFDSGSFACCYVDGRFGGLVPCGPSSKVSPDRSKSVFWDPFHPSELLMS
ncbi:peroxidase 29 [Hibiscus syriacus]|uniref:Peroxidase 29 n=1 Tax=Hibiscus syriacus TaxID=106335 RepID=A0A6A3D398_HIBSY|nr:peroxidase 29 [Hibiscus syriacus]